MTLQQKIDSLSRYVLTYQEHPTSFRDWVEQQTKGDWTDEHTTSHIILETQRYLQECHPHGYL